MWRSRPSSTRGEDIQRLFDTYASGSTSLSASGLLRFLHEKQREPSVTMEQAEAIIHLYERENNNRSMSLDGFLRFMESKHCTLFNQAHKEVYQDMGQPLTSYFISSSHNTYLAGNQIVGHSNLKSYENALTNGCRCLELDCWDGPNLEPIVYHGHTLTTKILFKDVVQTIEQHAFEVSAYPLILSLENHCSRRQQEVMAHYLVSILGDKLLSAPLAHPTTGDLPSPDDLKFKILIKNKKLQNVSSEEPRQSLQEDSAEDADEEESDEDETDTDDDGKKSKKLKDKVKFWSHKSTKRIKKKKKAVAAALSDLVIYTRSVKFSSFSYSRDNQNSFENTSMSEKVARKLVKSAGADFVAHNQRFLSRIYPAATRTDSSNFNPQEFWNVGAQLVALNFQSRDLAIDLNNGRFLDNGGCGYILKPEVLMSSRKFDPASPYHDARPRQLQIQVICGSHEPKMLRPAYFVQVEVHGVACDVSTDKTHTNKNNSREPYWGTVMNFTVTIPELCLIRFCLFERINLLSSVSVAHFTLPLLSMMQGYRWVPLQALDENDTDPVSLFVHVRFS
ncbi:unnamed protein product [Knipowitschia caucasica]